MMTYLLPIAVGAVIGLFTNWIAIVMLFRPHREVRLFGKRLPLTPGLIPRRQQELADKLGEVIEEELLTPEGVAKSIRRPSVEFAVQKAAMEAIGDTLQGAPTAGLLLQRFFGLDADARVEAFAVRRTLDFLSSESGRDKLRMAADGLYDHLRETLAGGEVRRELAKGFASPLYERLTAGDLTFAEALPEEARLVIEERLQGQVRPLLEGATTFLGEPQAVELIARMLQEKVEHIPLIGPMAKGFLTPERVGQDIVPKIQSAILSEPVERLVREKLQEGVAGFWQQPLGRFLGKLSEGDLTGVVDNMLHLLITRALGGSEESRETFRTFLVNGLSAGANEKTVGDLLHRIFDSVFGFDVRAAYIRHSDAVERWVARSWAYLREKLAAMMPELLGALSIRQVVSEQIASFPIPTLERLIVTVVNKELKLITVLGGVLGAIIGFFQALLAQV